MGILDLSVQKLENYLQKNNLLIPRIENGPGLGGGDNNLGFPGNQAGPFTQSISTTKDTFNNLRWYFVSNDRQLLSQLYVEISLFKTVCDVPVDDALRGGVTLKSKQLSEEQLEELTNSLDRDDDLNTVGQAAKWNRAFGGAGIMILTDQDPKKPLRLKSIGPNDSLEFRAVDMWELFWDKQNSEGYDATLQEQDFTFYNYYSIHVHKSRVMRLKGLTAPSFLRPRLRGWGFSVIEGLIRSLNQYLRATDVAYDVLDEFKLDIFKIKNLVNTLLSPQANQKVYEQIARLNYSKNYQNAMVLDSEDDYQQKQLSFAGLAETMEQIRMQIAADMRMPMIKLFGIGAGGLNASDEGAIEVYNAMVESEVRNKIKYDILRICEIKSQQMFGIIPDDLSLEFRPLKVMSAEQEENVKTQKFARIMTACQGGLITSEEFRDAVNRGKLMDVQLDPTQDITVGGFMQDTIDVKANPAEITDIDNPGANRIDTKRSRPTEIGGAPKGVALAEKQVPTPPKDPKLKEPGPDEQKGKVMPKKTNDDDDDPLMNPGKVDEAKWEEAKKACIKEYGKIKWAVVTHIYEEMGGTFG